MWFFSRDPTKDFQYEIGDIVPGLENKSIWRIHQGKKKANNDPVSVFVFELNPSKEDEFEIAKNCLKRLKTLRHPNVVTYIDSLEADKVLYLVTESVEPLQHHLEITSASSKQRSLAVCWGLHQVIKGLSFLINDCGLSHNNVCMPSIFVDKAGEWKIGGVEYMSSSDYALVKTQSELRKYNPPEANDAKVNKWACDMWGFGCLIWEAFNGPLHKPASLKSLGKIPKNLQSGYCELVAANPRSRSNPKEFLSKHKSGSGAYFNTSFIRSMLFLEEIQIKENSEKQQFISSLSSNLDDYPSEICKYKILPQLLNAFDFGNAGSSVLGPLFKLSKLLNEEEYQKSIVPCVVKLFSLKDRATRIKLLQQMESLTNHLQAATVNDSIFPQLSQGFLDTSPVIREETVKCMLYLAPKLNYNNLNVEVMKHLARLQAKDEQGGIRTNTTVCLGKIASYLHPQIRQKVLIPAFSRAMRDQFPPARIAGILAFSACQCFFTLSDSASKVLPILCHLTVDPEKSVREQIFRTINGYLSKLEKVSENPSLTEEMEAQVNAGASSGITNAAATWAGWAVSSLTSKFYKTSLKKSSSSENTKSSTPEVPKSLSDNALSTSNSTKTIPILEEESENSDSDYDKNDWNDDWGQMEVPCYSSNNASPTDGWTEDNTDFGPVDSASKPASSYDWSRSSDNPDADEFFSSMTSIAKPNSHSKPKPLSQTSTSESSWATWDTNSFPEKNSDSQIKTDLARRAREERKEKRQKELMERRAARQGPMKLGERLR